MGGVVDGTTVCLAIYGEDLDPDDVSRTLGRAATQSHRRGDQMKSGTTTWRKGAWLLSMRGKDEPEVLTAQLIEGLPTDEEIWSRLASRYSVQMRYGLLLSEWNQGLELSPRLLGRIARMHAVMILDIYGPEDSSGENGGPDG
jgi:hypothetical protein